MSDREERRDEGLDDLFGDLDEFFAPIEDVEWAEEPEGEPAAEEPAAEEPAAEEPADEEPAGGEPSEPREDRRPPAAEAEEAEEDVAADLEDWSPRIDIPDEEELLGEVEAEPAPEEPAEEEPPAPVGEDAAAAGAGKAPVSDAMAKADVPGGGATAEMSGEEWDHLRAALGDEEEEVAEEEVAAEAAPDEREVLSVDDLSATPPQYADLPRDRGAEEPEEPGEEPVVEEPVLAEEATFEAEEAPAGPPGAEDRDEEMTSEEIEAAADHFASGLRQTPEEVERDLLSDLEGEEAEQPLEAEVGPPEVEPREVESGQPEPPEVEPLEVEAPEVDLEEEPLAAGPPPTWQEPAAGVEEEPPAPPGGRNLPAAVVSGLIVAGAAIALLAIGKGPFTVLAVGLLLLGQGELYAVMKSRGYQPATALGLVSGAFIMIGAYVRGDSGQGEAAVLLGLALGMLLTVFWYTAAPAKARRGLVANVAATILGIVYVPFLVSFALLLLAIPGSVGRNLLLIVVGLTVLFDVVAYAVGTLWGNRPLAPSISPHKSWEGVIGATFVLLLVGLAIIPNFAPFRGAGDGVGDPLGVAAAVGLALVIAVAAPLGDLVESAIKRDLGVKDMGSLLPGHGGVLDRVDAILFAAPAAYFFIRVALA